MEEGVGSGRGAVGRGAEIGMGRGGDGRGWKKGRRRQVDGEYTQYKQAELSAAFTFGFSCSFHDWNTRNVCEE